MTTGRAKQSESYDHLDFDPLEVPVRPAATVMLVDDRPDLHVLMMRKTPRTVFAGGMWVFPGGAVDAADRIDELEAVCQGRTDRVASQELDVDQGGLAYWVAALRETFEEAGVLLTARPGPHEVVDALGPRLREHRHRLNAGELDFVDLIEQEDLLLDTSSVHYTARWVTPVGSPRRFDARFFVAGMPQGQTPVRDEGETIDEAWFRPADALDQWRAGHITMMSPTVRMLSSLARFDSAAHVLEAGATDQPDERARVVDPDGEYHVVLPGDPGYDDAEREVESGWVRLRPLR